MVQSGYNIRFVHLTNPVRGVKSYIEAFLEYILPQFNICYVKFCLSCRFSPQGRAEQFTFAAYTSLGSDYIQHLFQQHVNHQQHNFWHSFPGRGICPSSHSCSGSKNPNAIMPWDNARNLDFQLSPKYLQLRLPACSDKFRFKQQCNHSDSEHSVLLHQYLFLLSLCLIENS